MRKLFTLAIASFLVTTTAFSMSHKKQDIVDVASKAGSFNTLIAAAKAAGLVDALKGDGPLTVFAPTDDAFAKLPEGTVETLLKPENKEKLSETSEKHSCAYCDKKYCHLKDLQKLQLTEHNGFDWKKVNVAQKHPYQFLI